MIFRAYFLFDGYPVAWEVDSYSRWLFTKEDRVIRHRTKGERNVLIHDLPENQAEWDEPETDYLYVVTAKKLRQRLSLITRHDPRDSITYIDEDTVYGENIESLQSEFERHRHALTAGDTPKSFADRECGSPDFVNEGSNAIVQIPERADAIRGTTLDDWLLALKEVVRSGATHAKRITSRPTPKGPTFDTKALADIILSGRYPVGYEFYPQHELHGFPCTLLAHIAVAMLEIIPDNAECALNVTELVENDRVYCFEDLMLADALI
ncbi:HEPN/Toprim-associated domain-containing protein [Paraburkholderia bannensis]|uniref:HEPN/Toprim-associated domain-containing protein n=1 Tax=Paraburkholderia bannensis TaxID=765414 RepID=UPI002AB1971E|nr:HEPN/Toprim-associated domain-containing protein [Paraburkholderia bannensis]